MIRTRSLRHAVAAVVIAFLAAGCPSPGPTESPSTPKPSLPPVATADPEQTPGPPVVRSEQFIPFETAMTVRRFEGDEGYYVIERDGGIWRYVGDDRTKILDIPDEVSSDAEQGLYDLVVSPDREFAYIHFTGVEKPFGDHHLREYRWTGKSFEGAGREVFVIPDPYPHHNGGQLEFGPDGYLYIGIGDGGTKTLTQLPNNGDPHGYGRSNRDLLGNILRIDPRPSRTREYTIPKGNPFVGKAGADEVWAYGLRNPWKFSFDRETGDLWVGDVGHRFIEEVNFQPKGSKGGQNYGWSAVEGSLAYKGEIPKKLTPPVFVYPHTGGPCAIISGYVYRGSAIPDLRGWFVYGDFCSGQLNAIRREGDGKMSYRSLGVMVEQLVAFGQDLDGELLAVSYNHGIYKLLPP